MKGKIISILAIAAVVTVFLTFLALHTTGSGGTATDALNAADSAWVSVAAALVMLMTPALGASSTAGWCARRTSYPPSCSA